MSGYRLRIERRLRQAGLYPRRRVFGIGLSKTGTVSLTTALNRLGFRTLHYPHDPLTFEELKRGECRLSVLDDYDGIADIPAIPIYRDLARVYPRARFILTVREETEWLSSVRAHWLRFPSSAPNSSNSSDIGAASDLSEAPSTPSEGADSIFAFRRWTREAALGVAEFDASALARRRGEHQRQVEEFFADSPERLLVLNICGGEGWEKLCPFLGRPIPKKEFPWNHRAPE